MTAVSGKGRTDDYVLAGRAVNMTYSGGDDNDDGLTIKTKTFRIL